MRALKLLACIVAVAFLPVLSGCYACTRHISTVRPELVQPDAGLSERYRLASLSVAQGSKQDQEKMLSVVKKSLLSHYPQIFTDSAAGAIPLSVHVTGKLNIMAVRLSIPSSRTWSSRTPQSRKRFTMFPFPQTARMPRGQTVHRHRG